MTDQPRQKTFLQKVLGLLFSIIALGCLIAWIGLLVASAVAGGLYANEELTARLTLYASGVFLTVPLMVLVTLILRWTGVFVPQARQTQTNLVFFPSPRYFFISVALSILALVAVTGVLVWIEPYFDRRSMDVIMEMVLVVFLMIMLFVLMYGANERAKRAEKNAQDVTSSGENDKLKTDA